MELLRSRIYKSISFLLRYKLCAKQIHNQQLPYPSCLKRSLDIPNYRNLQEKAELNTTPTLFRFQPSQLNSTSLILTLSLETKKQHPS